MQRERAIASCLCRFALVGGFLLCLNFFSAFPGAYCSRFHTSSKLARTRAQLKRLNKPALRSIKSPDGDIIDCVELSKQPAFDHPQLRSHKIQMKPPSLPKGLRRKQNQTDAHTKEDIVFTMNKPLKLQLWHWQEETCPKGTVPIRRTSESDLLRQAGRLSHYGKKFHKPACPLPLNVSARVVIDENGHQHAITYVEGDIYYGAKAIMNVWGPSIDMPNEFSLSQIWVLAGSFDAELNSIEAGWQVNPELYGDNNTRLFTYWTSDSYEATGCYNLLCSGFVQISDQVALGATISPLSTYDSKQFDIDILIWKDQRTGNWWMSFGEDCVLGYWPSSLFSYLAESANMVEWGGEVLNTQPGGRHTTTHMGSGHFPSERFGKASYFSNLQVVDVFNNLRIPPSLNTFSENPTCYDVQASYNGDWGYHFYFGGPGLSEECP